MGYSWTPINKGDIIRAAHFNEIKDNLEDLYQDLQLDSPSWTYFPVSVGQIIKKDHIQELRDKTDYADDMNYCRQHKSGYKYSVDSGDDSSYKSGYKYSVDSGDNSGYDSSDNSGYDSTNYSTDNSSEDSTHHTTAKDVILTIAYDEYCNSHKRSENSNVYNSHYSDHEGSTNGMDYSGVVT